MVLSKTASETDASIHSTFASRYVRISLPRFEMPENSIPKEAAYQIINDELMLDGNPRLNLASFVTTWMEPELVIREDFSRTLAERLVADFEKVLRELDTLPAKVHAKMANGKAKGVKKTEEETTREVTAYWKKFVETKKTNKNKIC
ncbi:hypothetical protein BRARA_I02045 [Brassica rapa]|uniref:Glutamate decarboxylase n=1 Tax=Brassica campestris TaxID=3711 RepID=A0A397Y622_BRACM|nr:hypothetical protein BRARA_I02045 [Brassica rapa]